MELFLIFFIDRFSETEIKIECFGWQKEIKKRFKKLLGAIQRSLSSLGVILTFILGN